MSKQTKHRYLNSFFMATSIYLIASFFMFYVFADTLIVPPKEETVKTISLQHVALKEEPTPPQAEPEPVVEEKPEPEPIVEKPTPIQKKIEKPKPKKEKVEHKKIVEKKPIEKPIEKVEQKTEVIPVPEAKPVEALPSKPMMSASEIESIESEYLSKVRFHIEKNKTYPKIAKRLNQSGKVHVTFLILKDGKIKHCKVHKSSNFESLDNAAIEIFDRISSFEPIPEKLDKNSWEITVPIVYQITRN